MGRYAKAIVPILIAALQAVQGVLSDGGITPAGWREVISTVIIALGVLIIPNQPSAQKISTTPIANHTLRESVSSGA